MISFSQTFLIMQCDIPKETATGISFTGKSTFSLSRDLDNKSGEMVVYLIVNADSHEGGCYEVKIKVHITYVDKNTAPLFDLIFMMENSIETAKSIISYEMEKQNGQYFTVKEIFNIDEMLKDLELKYNELYHS